MNKKLNTLLFALFVLLAVGGVAALVLGTLARTLGLRADGLTAPHYEAPVPIGPGAFACVSTPVRRSCGGAGSGTPGAVTLLAAVGASGVAVEGGGSKASSERWRRS